MVDFLVSVYACDRFIITRVSRTLVQAVRGLSAGVRACYTSGSSSRSYVLIVGRDPYIISLLVSCDVRFLVGFSGSLNKANTDLCCRQSRFSYCAEGAAIKVGASHSLDVKNNSLVTRFDRVERKIKRSSQ